MEEQPLEEVGQSTPTAGEGQAPETANQENIPQQQTATPTTKTFTQEELDKIIKDRLDRHGKSIYSKYGVQDESGFDEIFTRAEAYAEMKERYAGLETEINRLNEELAVYQENALLNTQGVSLDRYDDVKTWFKGKGEKITEGTLREALQSHPEWGAKAEQTKPIPLGSAESAPKKEPNSDEIAKKYFGLDHFVD